MSILRTYLKFGSFLAVSSVGQAAWAQDCSTDAECPKHYRCDLPPTAGNASDGESASSVDSSGDSFGAAGAQSSGAQSSGAQASDQPASDQPVSGSATQRPSGDPSATSSNSTPRGRCEPAAYLCASDADCPEPTYCNNGECQWKLVFCEASTACGANYQCTPIGSTSCVSASDPGASTAGSSEPTPVAAATDPGASPGSGKAGAADAAPGGSGALPANTLPPDAPVGTSEPPAVQCTESSVSVCFPRPVSCVDVSQCPAGWACETLRPGGPKTFDGIERACLPPGVTGVINREIGIDAESEKKLGVVGGRADEGSNTGGGDGQIPETSHAMPSLGTQGGSEGRDACSVATVANPRIASATWLSWLPLLAAASRLRRRSLR